MNKIIILSLNLLLGIFLIFLSFPTKKQPHLKIKVTKTQQVDATGCSNLLSIKCKLCPF